VDLGTVEGPLLGTKTTSYVLLQVPKSEGGALLSYHPIFSNPSHVSPSKKSERGNIQSFKTCDSMRTKILKINKLGVCGLAKQPAAEGNR
jgi:hypothetical protein